MSEHGALHHPRYPDIPIWLRITGVEPKNLENVNTGSNTGRIPVNAKINWKVYEPELIQMLEDGHEPPAIAQALDLPQPLVSAKCRRMIIAGEVVPGWGRKHERR